MVDERARMEGIDRRLHEKSEKIRVESATARRESEIADVDDIARSVTVPRDLVHKLDGSMPGALCDQKMEFVWPSGPWQGKPITLYCDEPLCITEGVCTGPRFVPHIDQWTSQVPGLRQRRTPEPTEIVAAVKIAGSRAAEQTGRPDGREDSEVLDHVRQNWQKTIEQIRGPRDGWKRA